MSEKAKFTLPSPAFGKPKPKEHKPTLPPLGLSIPAPAAFGKPKPVSDKLQLASLRQNS
jgi:hypothetical protein